MKIAACLLALSAGVYSAAPADVKPAPATPAAKPDKTEVAGGTTLFCRDEGQIGTHFQRTHCSTLEQLKQAELSGKEYVNAIQQQGSAVPFKGP